MSLNLDVFQEPRGVMRVIQFIFAIWAFAKTVNYSNEIYLEYCSSNSTSLEFTYPFQLDRISTGVLTCNNKSDSPKFSLVGDFSSDAQFFVSSGVLSMLYCVGISVFYVFFNALYESNALMPKTDFLITLLLAVLWLSGSAAWANGIVGLKSVTNPENIISWDSCKQIQCLPKIGSFSGLNISITLGFLNFFLWTFDLWFLYKETEWFKEGNKKVVSSNTGVTAA